MTSVYFDHNATTPVDPRVAEAMIPWLTGEHGNPSSLHRFGRAARAAVEAARRQVADLVGGTPGEIVFSGSGSESNNAVLDAIAHRYGHRGHIVLSSFEHPSVEQAVRRAETRGMTATRVPPGEDGVVSAAKVLDAVQVEAPDATRLVCLMLANNELGTLQPVAAVARACQRLGIPVLTDAVQAVGKHPVDGRALGVDYLTLAGHKFHGPLGVAALWIRDGACFAPSLVGGGQERGRRSSTENVPGIVGLGVTAALAREELDDRVCHLRALRDRLEAGLLRIPGVRIHSQDAPRLPHTTNVAFPGATGLDLLHRLDAEGFAVSTGAACNTAKPEPSATLTAMGIPAEEALATLRISFGVPNTLEEVERFLGLIGPWFGI
jgi:cysteine desulfurase